MITRSPFGAISYNTIDFLRDKLNALIEEGILQFWYFIYHHKEEDEKKDHIHVYLVPCKMIDTFAFQNLFDEFDPKCPELPLKLRVGGHSKFADKYLYDKHDVDYLTSKGLTRHFHYNDDDFEVSDEDYFWELIHTSDFTKWKKEADFKRSVKKGVPFESLLDNGFVPIQQIYQYRMAYFYLAKSYYGSEAEKRIDKETGEVLPFIYPEHFNDDEGV